jgi:hypothetical protein
MGRSLVLMLWGSAGCVCAKCNNHSKAVEALLCMQELRHHRKHSLLLLFRGNLILYAGGLCVYVRSCWAGCIASRAPPPPPHPTVVCYMLSCSALVFFLFKHQCGRLAAPHQGDFNLLTSFPNFPVNYLSFWRGSSKY